ncbi:uncharacterized protein LOC131931659 [Physella acuta]|uniref:uncharacterized protein LOC131931659 n=1 Tax=Physella acuta TaxID=109671 RepID=UPI0027DDD498|nr:uncharacterized protein LOC131931659 [Physella acuta]XP_059144472.1 uncharacterized protein LOC131931659 [Physella acuta]XP_059144473.1 uncharacterized protein LOC131931659 [Physella acuta]XP_059144474.1 uncharacterized protein LOC131931659 [Physella acuta]XP_059144475.1 uncharacterized protein LOC131931659 [Physella acuta]
MNEFSSPCTDEPLLANPRVHVEGRENYERNHKASDWFAHNDSPGEVKPEARLRSEAARENAMKNRGSMNENMQGYANPAPVRNIHPRGVKPEAQDIAELNKGDGMRNLIENYGNLEVSPRPAPKVKGSDAEEYQQRQHGSTKLLLDHYSTEPIPASEQPPKPRLGLGAEEIADKHKGERMGPLMRLEGTKTPREPKQGRLHQVSAGSGWDEIPPQHRMRPEGEGIAQKNSADSISEIMLQNNMGVPQKTAPKVMKHMSESPTPRKPPQNRVRLDGVRNMERARNQDEMSAIMHGSPVQQARPDSGRKVLPHMQRSELW